MEKERHIKKYALLILVVAILGLSIAFAFLSKSLLINGSAKVGGDNLKVIFEKISGAVVSKSNDVTTSLNEPTITDNNTTLNLGEIEFNAPGDYYEYSVNIHNIGSYNAKITGLDAPNLSVDALEYMDFSITYENGLSIDSGDIINKGNTKKITIRIAIKSNLADEVFDAIPDDTEINLNGIAITYTQTDEIEESFIATPAKDAVMIGVVAEDLNSISSRYGKNINDFDFSKVKSIEFTDTNAVVDNADGYWDASGGLNTVTASYITDPEDNLYKLYIGGEGGVYAPADSKLLFAAYGDFNNSNLKTINLKYLNTSKVTNMSGMFEQTGFISLNLSNFVTSNVTDMSYMFSDSALTSLDLSNFDTSKVEDMQYMFGTVNHSDFHTGSIKNLDISSFNFSSINTSITNNNLTHSGFDKLLSYLPNDAVIKINSSQKSIIDAQTSAMALTSTVDYVN